MAQTGWTWAEVGQLTVRRFEALCRAWRRRAGIKDDTPTSTPRKDVIHVNDEAGWQTFLSMWGSSGGVVAST